MKISLLRICAMWRRFRRGAHHRVNLTYRYDMQIESLMRRANPFANWNDRANWMVDVADWLRRQTKVSLLNEEQWRRIKLQRVKSLLDWLDSHRDVRRVVQATVQKTLREAAGPELFCSTGLPREPALFSEFGRRIMRAMLPRPPVKSDLSTLFIAMFPRPSDADWLRELDQKTLARLWRLCADDNIAHTYAKQIDDALHYLAATIIATGISPAFRQRLEPRMPLLATPFMTMRRELEKYLMAPVHDDAALRSVRMLIAVCQAQTDRIYAHLDEYGVSVGLVYHVDRMRAQLARMARLIALREAQYTEQGALRVQEVLVDLITAHHQCSAMPGVVRRSFNLLTRKMVERHALHEEQYVARDAIAYRAILSAGCVGGIVVALAALGKAALSGAGLARFFEGLFVSLNYAVAFLAVSAIGGVLAARVPAVTVPALAERTAALDSAEGLHGLKNEVNAFLRAQVAAMIGNLVSVIPAMLALAIAFFTLSGIPIMAPSKAIATMDALSIAGPTLFFAAITGVLLWLASIAASMVDNWFSLHQLRDTLTHHRRLVFALGASRAQRCACWLEQHIAGVVGSITLAFLLGMTPVIAEFFGVPLEVRHVILATATLTAAAGSVGWDVLGLPAFWFAVAAIGAIGIVNVAVAFLCALLLALRVRDVPARLQRAALRMLLKQAVTSPGSMLFPMKEHEIISEQDEIVHLANASDRQRTKTGP